MLRLSLIPLALVTVELGLTIHSAINRYESQLRPTETGQTRVLLIGDSVLGGPRDLLIRYLYAEFYAQRPGAFEVTSLTQPGLTSRDVAANISDILAKHNPQVTVLLLGRSDVINSHHPDAQASRALVLYDWAAHLRSVRLFWLIFDDLETAWRRFERIAKSKLPSANPGYLQIVDSLAPLQARMDYAGVWEYLEDLPSSTWTNDGRLSPTEICRLTISKLETALYLNRADVPILIDSAVKCTDESDQLSTPIAERFEVSLWLGDLLRKSPRPELTIRLLHRAIELNPQHPEAYFALGWMASDKNDCRSTIPYFEQALRLDPEDRHALTRLSACYRAEDMGKVGREYFQSLLPLANSTKTLIHLLISGNGAAREQLESELRVPAKGQDHYESRDAYITALWLNRELGNRDEVNRLFRDWPRYAADPDTVLDEKAYQNVVGKILESGSKLIALQYPPDPDWEVLHALRPFDHGVEFLSMRSVFNSGTDKQDISDDLEEDFLHLTPAGAKLFADGLAAKVIEMSSP